MFLDSLRERQEEEERQRKEKDGEEVRGFKEFAEISLIQDFILTHGLPELSLHEPVQPITHPRFSHSLSKNSPLLQQSQPLSEKMPKSH